MNSKTFIILLTIVLLPINIYPKDKKSEILLGGEINGSLVLADIDLAGHGPLATSLTGSYAVSFIGEYPFTDYFAIGFGLGMRYYTLFGSMNTGESVDYVALGLDATLSFRFNIMPLISEKSRIEVLIGVGADIQPIVYSVRNNPNKHLLILDTYFGAIGELGVGYNITDTVLMRVMSRYNHGFIDLDRTSEDDVRASFVEFSVGVLFRI
ncbi:MAG: porin family protein [Spirochaetota bacterium]|nr:porin family protein [Spirochaetota bacterium]